VGEPALLGRGLEAWSTGHAALLASRLLGGEHALPLASDVSRGAVSRALARSLTTLRMAGVPPDRLDVLARSPRFLLEEVRLRAVADLYRGFHESIEGRLADPATILRTAAAHLTQATWLQGARVVIVEGLEIEPLEKDFVAALARAFPVVRIEHEISAPLLPGSFGIWAASHGIGSVPWESTPLGPIAPPPPASGLLRLRKGLFAAPDGAAIRDGAVELLTAAGEAAEVRAIVRRLLRQASRGVPFEEMGIVLPRPEEYAHLFSDTLDRCGIPFRLHPSLPLRTGRAARSLLLLLRCRSLSRPAVLEFLTFAPVRYDDILGVGSVPTLASWEEGSRNAGITQGIDRWRGGLGVYARGKRREAEGHELEGRRAGALRRADEVDALLKVVETLAATLDTLAGEASWPEWSDRLLAAFDLWVGDERDRLAVADVLRDLAGLSRLGSKAAWAEVEGVIEARLEWERVPMDPPAKGAIHIGALDAIAGLPFRFVAIPGLVEGGYPGPIRPDPFLLDAEREAMASPAPPPLASRQLSLFDAPIAAVAPSDGLPTSQDRLLEARRLFHRALSQATEHLLLSYPRAEARSGRERLPSLFFVSAASALEGRPLDMAGLGGLLVEDDLRALEADDAVDVTERDRGRMWRTPGDAAVAIASGNPFVKGSLLAAEARSSGRVTPFDGLVELPGRLGESLDPIAAGRTVSASRLRVFADCGFQYLLKHVLRLEAVEEPEDRMGLDPMERGTAFHEIAERFLREHRKAGDSPLSDTVAARRRIREIAEEVLASIVEGSPPRYGLLWDMERARLYDLLHQWLTREVAAPRGTPAHFEVGFGVPQVPGSDEPHLAEPLEIELAPGRTLRVSGKIDRIDFKADGSLVVRDYKTGRAPKDDGGLFRGGRQLQIPFYVKAASVLFPGRIVSEAFLDYVDGGRMVAFDPARATGEEFLIFLREIMDALAAGLFVQDASACRFCDFTRVCGPQGLIASRQQRKRRDPRVSRLFRMKEAP
jgi:ATP-dependent helicase/nuclease subunit B